MTQVITCPAEYQRNWALKNHYKLFLAGGISNCRDWQVEMIKRLSKDAEDAEIDNLILINPRRHDFDITNPKMSEQQIEWEYHHLELADGILFWFPYETLCPITLYELGKAAAQEKEIFVGCHPGYVRKFDVEFQLKHLRPEVKVRDNFQDLINDVVNIF